MLGAYRTLTIQAHFDGDVGENYPLIVGMGTSDSDITGKLSAIGEPASIFPTYTPKSQCLNWGFGNLKCKGKGFAYVLIMVPASSSIEIGLQYSPTFTITTTGAFPGTNCRQATLQYSSGWKWREFPVMNKPKNGTLTFDSLQWLVSLPPGHFVVEAFHCF